MTSFTEEMQRRGMVPGSRTLDLRVTPAGATWVVSCMSPRRSRL